MTGPTATKDPEQTLVVREIAPGVTTLSVPFLRFNKFKFGGRATIVRLVSGNLAVFSPVALTPKVKGLIGSSPVSYLIAPDFEHHIFLSAWAAAFPSAKIIGPEGLPEKRAQQNKTNKDVTIVPFSTVFTTKSKLETEIDAEFDGQFSYEYADAHPNKELVFYHRASRTLIQADLIFNLPATEQYSKTGTDASSGIFTRLFTALANTQGDAVWQKRLNWYVQIKDHESFRASVRRIQAFGPIENIVPCHGDSIVGNGQAVFDNMFQWFLAGKRKPVN